MVLLHEALVLPFVSPDILACLIKNTRCLALQTQPFLLTEKGMSYRRLLDEHLAQRDLEIQPGLEMGDADLICRLVEEDMGLSLLPDYVTEDAVRRGALVRLNVADFKAAVWKQLLYRRDKWVSLPMQAMIAHLSAIPLGG